MTPLGKCVKVSFVHIFKDVLSPLSFLSPMGVQRDGWWWWWGGGSHYVSVFLS